MVPNLKRSETLAVDFDEPTLWVDPGNRVRALVVPMYDVLLEKMPHTVTVHMGDGAVEHSYRKPKFSE